MADSDHYAQAAAGLEDAAKALRACGEEEAAEDEQDETPRRSQPSSLRDAERETRRRFARSRGEKPRDTSDD